MGLRVIVVNGGSGEGTGSPGGLKSSPRLRQPGSAIELLLLGVGSRVPRSSGAEVWLLRYPMCPVHLDRGWYP